MRRWCSVRHQILGTKRRVERHVRQDPYRASQICLENLGDRVLGPHARVGRAALGADFPHADRSTRSLPSRTTGRSAVVAGRSHDRVVASDTRHQHRPRQPRALAGLGRGRHAPDVGGGGPLAGRGAVVAGRHPSRLHRPRGRQAAGDGGRCRRRSRPRRHRRAAAAAFARVVAGRALARLCRARRAAARAVLFFAGEACRGAMGAAAARRARLPLPHRFIGLPDAGGDPCIRRRRRGCRGRRAAADHPRQGGLGCAR